MEMFFTRYSEHSLTITHLYNSIVKDHGIEAGLRGYSSPVSTMNSHNDLDDAAVQALNDVTTESYSLVQRYYVLKRRLLGLDKMTLADIYAPLPEASRSYDFATAKDLVLDAFGSFDADFQKHASDMFSENRIDAPPIPGKRGGAFCSSSTPDLKPYVLLNYTGKVRDVATMAHEIGHAIHSLYSRKQNLLNFHSILPLAETASIFSEMVLTDHFLKQETDPGVKISLISNKLEDIFASSHRQNMFSRFELQSHDRINSSLQGAEDLSELYSQELQMMFGDSVDQPEIYRWEWSSIPHIFNVPFYVYAYNFGNLLVLGLYQKYLEEGEGFKHNYKRFLSMGSSASPGDITKIVGVDTRDPAFWRSSLAYIEKLIDTLEELVASK
jgi:oligoendopeptidase F